MKPVKPMIVAALWLGAVACLLSWIATRWIPTHKATGFGVVVGGGWQGKLGIALLLFVIFGWVIPLAWGLRLLLKRG